MSALRPAFSLAQREIVRFYRQRSRVIGALVPPFLFWFLIGSGLGGSFRHQAGSQLNYLQYFFPGTIAMVVLFTAIFSTISIIDDRKEGFLQSVLVAPVPRWSIALGKILGGSILAFLQGLVFVLIAPALGIHFTAVSFLFTLIMIFGISFGLTGLGFLIAWQMDSTQGFHAIMNVFLMPMWFLSGALFPMDGAPAWLRWTMMIDPLTYGVTALRYGFYSQGLSGFTDFPTPIFCLGATAVFCALMFGLSVLVCERSGPRS